MKKMVGLMLTSVMALSLLAGCGGNKDDNTATASPSASPTAAATTAPPADDGTEEDDAVAQNEVSPEDLTGTVRVGMNPWKVDQTTASFALFNEKFPNIEVIQEPYDANPPGLITDLAAANDLPDMYYETARDAATLAEQGLLYPLNEFLDADPEAQNLPPNVMDGYTYNGYTYCVPNRLGMYMIAINTDIMDELNLDMPRVDWSYDEFKQFLINGTNSTYSGTEDTPGAYVIGASMNPTGHQHGYDQYTHTFDLVNSMVKGFGFLADLESIPGVMANTLRGDDNADYIKKFGEGDVGDGQMAWKMGKILCQTQSSSLYGNVMVEIDFDPYWHTYPQEPSVGLRPITQFEHSYMFANTANPQATFEVLKWLSYDPVGVGAVIDFYAQPLEDGSTRTKNVRFYANLSDEMKTKIATHPNVNDDMMYSFSRLNESVRADLDAFVSNYWGLIEQYAFDDAKTIEAAQDIESRANAGFATEIEGFLSRMEAVQADFNATH